jgi:hypothetical protein
MCGLCDILTISQESFNENNLTLIDLIERFIVFYSVKENGLWKSSLVPTKHSALLTIQGIQ